MATFPDDAGADREIKDRLRAIWSMGDYAAVAAQTVEPLGPALVRAAGVSAGDRVLDIAAGTGNAAIAAAETGADVTASDLAPDLLNAGKRLALARSVRLTWSVADAEDLPYADASFDAVVSCVGVMYAPHHRLAAAELVRVCRPGGGLGIISWTPEGFIGSMFAAMKPYSPPPPPGTQSPPLWGNREHVESLLEGRVREFRAERSTLLIDRFSTPKDFLVFLKAHYGPVMAVYASLASAPERGSALDAELLALVKRYSTQAGGMTMDWEYLLVTARRA
ncbi:class I SAM-dependent methyltransferase [Arthrobacter zhangbolii]|uniref:Class I SAM-dependent methyltransferase n=1 Tax=Arthrobacter zhangbolii TaxID=2886936 RepID=A0A9X1S8I4_9MICC|nr:MULTISPECIES: class I SAM-dependent methyltransferase [Arthrobacter]MCC3271451.1 class I SAM-dependent methyltransferase [Arthrobacter zhangbolii]MCC3293361.1 class I SAM-dependent methyltransferase [Arthrobacter zhangbolii]MDN3904522.1 class I SAM-dependent methyltransferase [Arthrobacter sp. YD2]UON90775.1 class I SAM-dependent methyltransferase [Arthrobacter zhangbolii]